MHYPTTDTTEWLAVVLMEAGSILAISFLVMGVGELILYLI